MASTVLGAHDDAETLRPSNASWLVDLRLLGPGTGGSSARTPSPTRCPPCCHRSTSGNRSSWARACSSAATIATPRRSKAPSCPAVGPPPPCEPPSPPEIDPRLFVAPSETFRRTIELRRTTKRFGTTIRSVSEGYAGRPGAPRTHRGRGGWRTPGGHAGSPRGESPASRHRRSTAQSRSSARSGSPRAAARRWSG